MGLQLRQSPLSTIAIGLGIGWRFERTPMATPGQLVKELAEVVGAPVATVAAHDRNLRNAGLRTVRGRGLSAPRATARDAASLLTAVLAAGFVGGSQVAESALAVQRYSATRLMTEFMTSDG